jgi:hypothetical protein
LAPTEESSGPSACRDDRHSEGPDHTNQAPKSPPKLKRNRIMKLVLVWIWRRRPPARRHFGNCICRRVPPLLPPPAASSSSINLPPSHPWWIQSNPIASHSLASAPSPGLHLPTKQAPFQQISSQSMAGGKSTGNAARTRKRVEATVLKRSRDGSAFTRWSVSQSPFFLSCFPSFLPSCI